MAHSSTEEVTRAVAELVATATDGTIDAETAHRSEHTFAEAGMTSLSFLRLVDALEITYGIEIDLENDLDSMRTAALIVGYLRKQGIE
ncbi:acyl carrier protein [Nocardia goodfellowii]|uniref:Acyl carrier protein n=1 Tax=Nocardia goodfellowii TaxID=882446 RepID=A0ABS4QMX8_9NOCA|nr:acyl carrier protein [Nocardia goodfellowii]MBP2193064.1 acyl carrier protein [Nocardia goodfellowii]